MCIIFWTIICKRLSYIKLHTSKTYLESAIYVDILHLVYNLATFTMSRWIETMNFGTKIYRVHIWLLTFLLFILLLTSFYEIFLSDITYMVSKLIDLLMTSSPSFMAKSYYVMTSNRNINLHLLVFIKHCIALKRILLTPWKEKFSRTHL